MHRPIMVAVGGDSGTGKTTLCAGLHAIFGPERIAEVCLDDYHSLDRAQRAAVGLTALNPRANDFATMEEDLWRIAHGQTIEKPVYDHRDGTFGARERLEAKPIVIVHGLFPLYTRTLRSLFDVSVWLDPQLELKIAWKIQRDLAQRGYTEPGVRAEIARRQADIDAHISPQQAHADLRVRFSRCAPEVDNARLDAQIVKGPRFRPLDYAHFASRSTHLRQTSEGEGSYPTTVIELDGDIDDETARAVRAEIVGHLGWRHAGLDVDGVGRFSDGARERISHPLALAQLLIARRICLVLDELADAIAA
ncbi:MAG TPA: phosphoribulokinase [Candidatus Sulfotelmatobacter sp.]|nr:phosphoribulokinase [Candidatus Sulfotelmatobacter sp.]